MEAHVRFHTRVHGHTARFTRRERNVNSYVYAVWKQDFQPERDTDVRGKTVKRLGVRLGLERV